MATLATVYNRILGPRMATAVVDRRALALEHEFTLRALPSEDIYLFVKEIDNIRVVREANPQARGACWKLILSGGFAVLLLIGILLPSAAGRLAGYQLEALRQEQQKLISERSALELDEARLLSPERLEELARTQKFIDPAPQRVVYLDGGKTGALAMNGKK